MCCEFDSFIAEQMTVLANGLAEELTFDTFCLWARALADYERPKRRALLAFTLYCQAPVNSYASWAQLSFWVQPFSVVFQVASEEKPLLQTSALAYGLRSSEPICDSV